MASSNERKPADLLAFMNGVKVALDLMAGNDVADQADFKKGLATGARILRFEKERFPALDRERIADGLGEGLGAIQGAYPKDEIEAAIQACSKFVKTPKPAEYAMLGKPAPAWEVGPWHQLPEGTESLDITDGLSATGDVISVAAALFFVR